MAEINPHTEGGDEYHLLQNYDTHPFYSRHEAWRTLIRKSDTLLRDGKSDGPETYLLSWPIPSLDTTCSLRRTKSPYTVTQYQLLIGYQATHSSLRFTSTLPSDDMPDERTILANGSLFDRYPTISSECGINLDDMYITAVLGYLSTCSQP